MAGRGALRTPITLIIVTLVLVSAVGGYALLSKRSEASQQSPASGSQETIEGVGPVPARLEVDDGLLKGSQVIALGPEDADLYIYIFYDVYCPYCGMEMTESYKYFEYLAQEYKVILADFLIHESGLESHAVLRCAAGQGAPVLEVLAWWYSNILKGKDPGMDGLKSQLSDKWGVNVDQSCVDAEKDKVLEVTQVAAQLGVRGTPTMVVYDAKNGKVVDAVVGYLGEDKLKSFIENAVAKAAVSG